MNLPVLSIDQAPEASRELLERAKQKYGFVPNLLGVMAHSPSMLKAYLTMATIFDQTTLNATERQVVLLAASTSNDCGYCVSAHSIIARMQNVPESVINALRWGEPIADARLEALRQFAAAVVSSRGWPDDDIKQRFLAAGFTPAQALEVIVGVGMKTLSNYTNHLANTALDEAFESEAWGSATV